MDFKLKQMDSVLLVPKIANVHFFEFPKGHETPPDKHPFCELIFVSSGTMRIESEEYTGKLKKTEMIIHSANRIHALACPKNEQTTVIIVGFECFSDKLAYFTKKPVSLNETEIKQLAAIVKEGRNVFAPPYNVPVYDMVKKKKQIFASEQMLKSQLEIFLLELIRKYEFFESEEDSEENDFAIGEIVEYIDNNFLEKITLDELAFLFRTNRSTLCREFKLFTGNSPIAYIAEKKIETAKEKLKNRKKTITQIADELQFESVPYFCKFFKKQTGLTPAEYRRTK